MESISEIQTADATEDERTEAPESVENATTENTEAPAEAASRPTGRRPRRRRG